MFPGAGSRADQALDRRRPWASGRPRFHALKSFADQRHPVVAEIHVRLVDKDRRRTKTAARHHFIGVGLELVLDRLLADACEEFDVVDAGLLAELRQYRTLRDILVTAPIGLELSGSERHDLLT